MPEQETPEHKPSERQGCLQRAGRIAGIVVLAIVTIVCFVARYA